MKNSTAMAQGSSRHICLTFYGKELAYSLLLLFNNTPA